MSFCRPLILITTLLLFVTASCARSDTNQGGPDTLSTRDTAARQDTVVASNPLTDTDTLRNPPTGEWSQAEIAESGAARGVAQLRDIRAGGHEGFDRIVVEFADDILPGYYVSYLDEKPTECGSGETITLQGDAVLEVRMEPARGYTDEGASTLDHGLRRFGLPAAGEARVSCDFEAVFTVMVGVTRRSDFRVFALENPTRLVVDVKHQEGLMLRSPGGAE